MQQEQYFKAVKASERLPETRKIKLEDDNGIVFKNEKSIKSIVVYPSVTQNIKALLQNDLTDWIWLEPIPIPDAAVLRSALEKIANPIKYLREEAEKDGGKLDGTAAIQLSKDANFLQSIASEALSAGDGWVRCEDGLPEDWSKDVWAMSKSKGEVEKMSAGNLVKYQQYYSHWHPELIPSPPIQ